MVLLYKSHSIIDLAPKTPPTNQLTQLGTRSWRVPAEFRNALARPMELRQAFQALCPVADLQSWQRLELTGGDWDHPRMGGFLTAMSTVIPCQTEIDVS